MSITKRSATSTVGRPAPKHARAGYGTAPVDTMLPDAVLAPSALFNAAFQRDEAGWIQILFLCDGADGDRTQLITMPDAKGVSTLWTYAKPSFRTRREFVRVGNEDAGAGTIGRPLLDLDGHEIGAVRSLNPGMVVDSRAGGLPTLSSIRADDIVTRCRWLPQSRVMLVTSARTVVVTREQEGYRYASFDHAKPGPVIEGGGRVSSRPTLSITSGKSVPAAANRERYEFSNGPWTYRVDASADNRAAGASLTVLKAGRIVQTTTASAYQMSARRIE